MSELFRRINAHPLAFVGTLFLIVAALSLARTVLIPVSLAILLTFLLNPLVRMLQRRGLKRIPAVIAVTVVAFVALGFLLIAAMSQVFTFANQVPELERIALNKIRAGEGSPISKFLGLTTRVTKEIAKADEENKDQALHAKVAEYAASAAGMSVVPLGQGALTATSALPPGRLSYLRSLAGKKTPPPVVVQSDPMAILSFYTATAQEVVRLVASTGLIVVLVIVMLIFREEVRDRFIRLTGFSRLTVTTKALDEAGTRIGEYMLRKSIVNAIFGGVVAVVLFAIGLPFAIMWGMLLAVLRYIPGLGIWLSLVPPLLLGLIAIESWWPAAITVALFLVGELLLVNVFEPRFVGPHIGLLPVATMVSLSFWTWLWGPIGLMLAVPITMCLAVLGKHVPQLSFLSVLLSDEPAMNPTLRYYQRLLAQDDDEATEIVNEYAKRRGCEKVYDEMMVPALSFARRDVAVGELAKTHLDFVFRTTGEILDDLWISKPVGAKPECASRFVVAGCPVGDTGDRLALRLIQRKLNERSHDMTIGAASRLSSEIVAWVQKQTPDIVCLTCIAPGTLAQSRFVCKRLRNRFPKLKIIVARLGFTKDFEDDREVIQQAGADEVCATVEKTATELIQTAQHLMYEEPKISAKAGA